MNPVQTIAACMGAMLSFATSAHAVEGAVPHRALINREGQAIGAVAFAETPSGLLISIVADRLPPGEHGFHIHETGRCDPKAGFSSAGDHFAPERKAHCFMVRNGPHAGDMPNQFVGDDGRLRAHVLNPRVTLDQGINMLADGDGSALIVHAGADDYRSQPSGEAGDHIACAVIAPPR